jgi:hypothetical protein
MDALPSVRPDNSATGPECPRPRSDVGGERVNAIEEPVGVRFD